MRFFLRGVAEQSRDALTRSQRLLDLWQSYRGRLASARVPALLLKLVDALFELVAITIPRAGQLLGVTPRAAQQNVEKLEKAGIIREVTGKQRHRIYVAHEIVATLEGTSEMLPPRRQPGGRRRRGRG